MRRGSMLSIFTALAVSATLPGCGLMFGGTHETIQVSSAPDSAKVTTIPPTSEFTTPATISLERKNDYSLTFEKAGYSTGHFQIQHHMRGGILALDVVFTGLLGIIPDAATGAWNGLSPRAATVTMTKVAMVPGPDSIQVGLHLRHTAGRDAASFDASTPGVTVRVERAPKR
jgi:hypothetical protein